MAYSRARHWGWPGKGEHIGHIIASTLTFYTQLSMPEPTMPGPALDRRLDPANTRRTVSKIFYANFLAYEGGYTDNDGNGSPANFWRHQGANPDIDVLN